MAKETNPKNTALEADVLKAAEGAVDQKAVQEKATEIAGKAPEGETVQGKNETMHGEPGHGTQLPGSNMPPVTNAGTPATFGNPALGNQADPEYLEFLEWKNKKAAADQSEATNLQAQTQVSDYDARRQAAEEAARKVYNQVMDGQATANATLDQSKNTDAASLHQERLKTYGPGYVVAKRQGIEQVFTAQTWKMLGGRSNKDGYVEVVAMPPEVANMKKAQ